MITKNKFTDDMFINCMSELYEASQPSITYDEYVKLSSENPDRKIYDEHYLSSEEIKYIIDKYVELYHLDSEFYDDCDILIRDMEKGCSKDKYVEPKNGSPGYRDYENVPPLSTEIGEENLKKVIDFIKMRKDFYKFNHRKHSFMFNMTMIAPCSNKETVLEFYKNQGTPITIEDRNLDYNYERYYLGLSEEEIQELIDEENE